MEENLETENDARRIAEVVPAHLVGRGWHARQQVIHLPETDPDVAHRIPIESDPGAHGECIVIDCCLVEAGIRIHNSKKGLSERSKFGLAKERNFGTGHVGQRSRVHIRAVNLAGVNAAHFDDEAAPIDEIQRDGPDAAIGAKRRDRDAGAGMNVGISGKQIDLGRILRGRAEAE